MKILLDTNFILTCAKRGIDFPSVADDLIDEEIEWIVPQQVLNELGKIKDSSEKKGADKNAAELGFIMLQNLDNCNIVELENHRNVDIAIVNYVLGKDIVVATMDRDLKKRIGGRILSVRGDKNLAVI
jgi:rRNA-processing protein FCF1